MTLKVRTGGSKCPGIITLFAVESPLSTGILLTAEVGLGKIMEVGLVLAQCLAVLFMGDCFKNLKVFCKYAKDAVAYFECFRYNYNVFYILAVSRKTRSIDMKISYKKLWVLLIQRDISKVTLRKEVGIAAGTMSKLNKGEEVALPILLRICDYLDCDIGDICEAVREGK